MSLSQDELDYSNDAQQRIAADLRNLRKRETLTLVAGTQEYALPDDVIKLQAVYTDQIIVGALGLDETLTLISSPYGGPLVHYTLEPGVIGFLPVPTEAAAVTLYYTARPQVLNSGSDFELAGDAEALLERLVTGMNLEDDGQPELAATEQAFYDVEMPRLRRLRLPEQRGRIANPLMRGVSGQ